MIFFSLSVFVDMVYWTLNGELLCLFVYLVVYVCICLKYQCRTWHCIRMHYKCALLVSNSVLKYRMWQNNIPSVIATRDYAIDEELCDACITLFVSDSWASCFFRLVRCDRLGFFSTCWMFRVASYTVTLAYLTFSKQGSSLSLSLSLSLSIDSRRRTLATQTNRAVPLETQLLFSAVGLCSFNI